MSLISGAKLGPYEIQSPIGAGGMGEVYRARDTRLGRYVALKILPDSFVRDPERLRRFEQEAHSVATLNHPNILAVFDIGQHNGSPYLVSELLEGETLRAIVDRGPLPQRKAIDYGVQIAQGLASAHEKGVVHRDVKPENIFVTKDGRIKILDFGLAKAAEKPGAAGAESDGATLTSSHTATGMVMGTAGYMAPEQVRGETADPRTDIFAFGAVLYEMLSGKRAFRRDTPAETMTAILREDPPDLTSSIIQVSPALDRIMRRCLEKNPEQRFQSAKDLSFALSALSGTDSSAATRLAAAPRRTAVWLWVAGFAAMVLVALVAWYAASRPAPLARMQFAIPVDTEVSHLAISPDGSQLAFVSPDEKSGIPMLSVQRVGSPEVRVLEGTAGATYPFWSPDGAYLAFFAAGKLQKMPLTGGAPQPLADVWSARGGSWGTRNVIIYEPDSGSPLWRVNADGSGAAPLTESLFAAGEQSHRWPVFLPDGNRFLFWAGNFAGKEDRKSGIFLTSLDGKEKKLVALAHSSFAFSRDHLYYASDDGHLIGVAFDPDKASTVGNATVMANVVSVQPSTYWASLTASGNDTLVYSPNAGAALSALTWMDRSGKPVGQIGEVAVQCNPTLSPDGSRVAVDISDRRASNVDIWIERVNGGGSSRFTFDPSEEVVGVWSRDGNTIAYRSAGGIAAEMRGALVLKAASGLEKERVILKITAEDDILPNSWALGDQQILCTHESQSGYHLETVDQSGNGSRPFQTGPGNQIDGMISPDGKWAAYASNESGTWEVYVTTFPGAVGKWQVSRGGGTEPRWRGDGKELFYLGPTGMLNAVAVTTIGGFSTGSPQPLFQFHGRAAISSTDVYSYDVSKDGKRFLVNRYVKPEQITPLTIVLHAGAKGPE